MASLIYRREEGYRVGEKGRQEARRAKTLSEDRVQVEAPHGAERDIGVGGRYSGDRVLDRAMLLGLRDPPPFRSCRREGCRGVEARVFPHVSYTHFSFDPPQRRHVL